MSARTCIALVALCALVQLGLAINGGSGCKVSGGPPPREQQSDSAQRGTGSTCLWPAHKLGVG